MPPASGELSSEVFGADSGFDGDFSRVAVTDLGRQPFSNRHATHARRGGAPIACYLEVVRAFEIGALRPVYSAKHGCISGYRRLRTRLTYRRSL
jgi:hypothetical protein